MHKIAPVFAAFALMAASVHAADTRKADGGQPELARDWVKMDVDRDGHITPDEMLNYEKAKASQKK
ncbi:hypothetical protein [Methyloversatilis thermotolerans]|uniref:hypothetical protein n=1 Tax=Methyloversatilis thermotolerans TaxID=1346290 RepID=UPI0003A80597|nr:hypothetical protein [Methyloversatilis thermotolerans]